MFAFAMGVIGYYYQQEPETIRGSYLSIMAKLLGPIWCQNFIWIINYRINFAGHIGGFGYYNSSVRCKCQKVHFEQLSLPKSSIDDDPEGNCFCRFQNAF